MRLGDSAALELIRVHDALVRRGLAARLGREVKHTGDGIMAAFDNVADAVHAAADIQWHFDTYNRDAAESLSVRIGIHAGIGIMASPEGRDAFGGSCNGNRPAVAGFARSSRLSGDAYASREPAFSGPYRRAISAGEAICDGSVRSFAAGSALVPPIGFQPPPLHFSPCPPALPRE